MTAKFILNFSVLTANFILNFSVVTAEFNLIFRLQPPIYPKFFGLSR